MLVPRALLDHALREQQDSTEQYAAINSAKNTRRCRRQEQMGLHAEREGGIRLPLLPVRQEGVLYGPRLPQDSSASADMLLIDSQGRAREREAWISPTGYEFSRLSHRHPPLSSLSLSFLSRLIVVAFFPFAVSPSLHLSSPSAAHSPVATRPNPFSPSFPPFARSLARPPPPGELCLYFSRLFLQMSDTVPALRLLIQRVREWETCGAARGTCCYVCKGEKEKERMRGVEK